MAWLNCAQSLGRVPPLILCGHSAASLPPQATFDPGQNNVPVRTPAFSAVTQIGSASFHQKGSSVAMVKVSPGLAPSSILFATMPLRRSEEHTSELQSLM